MRPDDLDGILAVCAADCNKDGKIASRYEGGISSQRQSPASSTSHNFFFDRLICGKTDKHYSGSIYDPPKLLPTNDVLRANALSFSATLHRGSLFPPNFK